MARAINVVGMHRSGTSLTARALNLLGVDFGSEEGLTRPGRVENPKGFWERKAIKELNDELLVSFGGSWSDPPVLEPGWEHGPALADLRDQAKRLLDEAFSSSELYGWKDPRCSILLPFWQLLVPDLSYVVCLRHPEAVARSLSRRGNEFEPERAYALWLRYTAAALVNTRGARRLLVFYEDFFEDLDRQVDALAAFLDKDAEALDPEVRAEIRSLADPSLFRNRTGPDDDATLPADVRAMWIALRAGVASSAQPEEEPFAVGDTAASARAAFAARADDSTAVAGAGRPDSAYRQEARDAQERVRAVQADAENVKAKLAAMENLVLGTEGKLRGTEGKLFGAEEQLRILREDLRKSDRQLEAARMEAERLARALDEGPRGEGPVEAQLRADLKSIENSVSWRVTKPLRAVKALLTKPRARSRRSRSRPAIGDKSGEESAPGDGSGSPGQDVTVVVPFFNAPEELERCVAALLRNTTLDGASMLLIDDASTDPGVADVLGRCRGLEHVTVLRNEQNLGFTRTVNRGLEEATGDVVLLNSDTEVGPRWLESLRLAAYSDPRIGTATAVSDNAGAFAVPEIGTHNPVPPGFAMDDVARLVAQTSRGLLPDTPTGNGFCLYLKREMIEAVGPFDAELFPRGYGEENDLCMRAIEAGWRHVVDDRTFVHHIREASFGGEKAELARAGREAVDRRHPSYTRRVRRFTSSKEMERVRATVRDAFAAAKAPPRRRILFVLHEGGGGTPATSADLIRGLSDRFDCFSLTSDATRLRLRRHGEREELVSDWPVEPRWSASDFDRPDFRAVAEEVLRDHAIELIHIRHLFKHSLDLPRVAREMGIPLVVSFHDFYFSCPTFHLLDETDTHCGGICTPGDGRCRLPTPDVQKVPPLKHRWINTWRERMGEVVYGADALVTTSEYAREVYRRSYPGLDVPFELIEHGRNRPATLDWQPAPPSSDAPVRILVPGNLDVHKGTSIIARLLELDRDPERLEFHHMGRLDGPTEGLDRLVRHGVYERDDFAAKAAEIAPSFAAIFSIAPETYCHALTEAWWAGIPVVATDRGALAERIRAHGGGWLVDPTDPDAAYDRLLALSSDHAAWDAAREEIAGMEHSAVEEMGSEYAALYERVLTGRRRFTPPRKRSPEVPRVAVLVPGTPGREPASTHVRVLRRATHPRFAEGISFDRQRLGALVTGDPPAAILVQRTAVEPGQIEALLDYAGRRQVPLVAEMDDDLLARVDDPEYEPFLPGIRRLLAVADRVIVSTQFLAAVLSEHTRSPISVVRNALDERLWFTPQRWVEDRERDGTDMVRLVYAGTVTHARDLAMLKPVLAGLHDRYGLDARLDVIGGEPPGARQNWYHRVVVPDASKVYPSFVHWLRQQAHGWDIALAPLEDTHFNRSKSDLKLLEYSALGLPSVASSAEPYAGWAHGKTVLHADNTPDAWAETVAALATDAGMRRGIAQAAGRYVRMERCLDVDSDVFTDALLARAESSDESVPEGAEAG